VIGRRLHGSTSSLFGGPNAPGLDITYAGETIQTAWRILGPVLIALAVLALRARDADRQECEEKLLDLVAP
jgi:hypothetical protein